MADVNANIGVHIDTSAALAELKNLQRQLANFHSSVSKSSAAAAMAQKGLQTNLLNSINATGKFRAQMGLVRTSTESFTHALETNKLSMREYFRFAGGSTKTFGKLFKQEFNTIGKVAEERVKKMQTQYIKMGRDASGAMKAISITPNTLNMKDYSTKLAVAAQKQALLNQLLKQGSTNLLNFGKNTQWAGRQLMVGFTIPLAYFGTAAAKTFMDLEKQAIRFKRVYGDMFTTTEESNKALADVQRLAEEFTKYGVAVADTMEMAANAAAMGKTGADLTAQVAQATRLAVLGGVEQAQALETTISVTNAFGVAAEDLASKINFLNAVENQTVVSIEDLTIAIPKAGPVVKQLGGDVEDLAFFLTAMKEGGINASEGANALKSGLASLINPTEKASKMLAGFGINIKGIVESNQGNIRNTVIGFAQALDTLDPLNRARAIEQLFGKFQFSRLSTLFQNVTKEGTQAARVFDLAGASIEELAILSERELGVLEDSISTDFKESIENLKLAIAPIGKEFLKAVTPIAKALGGFLEKFNNLGDGTKKFIVIATTLVGVIGPVLLMTFGLLLNAGANIIKLFATMRSGFLKAGTNSGLLAQQTQYLSSEQLEAATVAASLNQAHTRLTQSFAVETTAVKLLRQAYIDATIAATNFARANPGMMMPGFKPGMKGGKPKGFASGTTGLPGPRGAGDIIPILGAPGEAIIPAEISQDDRFKPLIAALVSGDIKGYKKGSVGLGDDFSHVGGLKNLNIDELLKNPKITALEKQKLQVYKQILISQGKPTTVGSYGSLAYSFDSQMNKALAKGGVSIDSFEKAWINRGPEKWMSSNIPPSQAKIVDDAILKQIKASGATKVTDAMIEQTFKNLPAEIKSTSAYSKMNSLHSELGSYGIGRGLGSNPKTSEAILADAKKKGYIKDYKIETRTSDSGVIKTKSLIVTNNDGTQVNLGRGSKTNRQYLPDTQDTRRKSGIINGQTSKAKSPALSVVGGGASDNRQVAVGKNETILNSKTTSALRSGKRVSVPGIGRFGLLGADQGIPKGQSVTSPGMAVSEVEKQFRSEQKSLRRQIEKVEQRRLVALKQELKIVEDKNKLATQAAPLTKQQLKEQKREVRAQRAQRVGRVAGPVAGIAGIGAMAGFMTGNNNVGMAMMGISALATIAPMLTNPIGLFVAAMVGLVAGFKLIDKKHKEMAKKQSEYIDSISGTTTKMKKVGEVTGKVGASELMTRRRQDSLPDKFSQQYNRAGQQFGTNFMGSDVGKEISKGFAESLLKDRSIATKQFALQLSSYVSDGVIDGVQAGDIARQIAVDFNDMSLYPSILGQLTSIIGPDGVNILTDPIKVRMLIIQEQAGLSNIQAEGIVAGDKGIIGKQETGKAREAAAAASAASYSQSFELAKAQVDATNLQYQKDLEILKNKQKIATTEKEREKIQKNINTLINKNKKDNSDLSAEMSTILKNQQIAYEKTSRSQQGLLPGQINFVRNAFLEASKQQVVTKFAGTQQEGAAKALLENTKNLKSTDLEVKINAIAASGTNPTLLASLINMYKNDEEQLNKQIDLAVSTRGIDTTVSLLGNLGMIEDADTKKQLFIDIINITDNQQFEDIQSALTKISEMAGKDFNVSAYLKTNGLEKLINLTSQLNKLDKVVSPINKVTQIENIGLTVEEVAAITSNWEYFMSLPNTVRKTAIQTYVVALDMVTEEQIQAEIAKRVTAAGAGVSGTVANYLNSPQGRAMIVDQLAMQATTPQYSPSQQGPNKPPPADDNFDGSGTRDTTLDELLKKLKLTRDASINAQGGLQELRRVMRESGGDLKVFNGLNQALARMGAESDFINFVGGMDNALEKAYVNAAKLKDGIIELTDDGTLAMKAYQEAQIGAFSVTAVLGITETIKQRDAFVKLTAAGVSAADALEMMSDSNFMLSISQRAGTEEIKDLIEQYNLLKSTIKTTQDIINPEKSFKDLMDENMKYYNFLEKEARAQYEPQIESLNNLIDTNERLIDVQQRVIEEKYDRPISLLNEQTTLLNQDLSLIDRAAESINKKYEEQEKALQQISDIQDEIADKEKGRITIADALTRGDISAAAKAIQEERQAAAQRAQERSSNLLQVAREKELAELRSSSGLTRAQIEEKIYVISQQIFALEQQKLPVAAEIQRLNDANYNIQVKQLQPLKDELKARTDNIDAARTAWESQMLAIEKAKYEASGYNNILQLGENILKRIKALWDSLTANAAEGAAIKVKTEIVGSAQEILQKSSLASANKEYFEKQVFPAVESGTIGGNELRDYAKAYSQAFKTNIIPLARGGMVPKYYASGGYSKGTDTIPAMLTPGEFVVRKNAVDSFGVNSLNKINDGSYGGSSVYNYSLNVNVKSDSSPDDIAKTVMTQIKRIDSQRIKTQRGA
jgi:TP901 family phage tail tape measure protein